MSAGHGDKLLELCQGADDTVLIVAPFIKDNVLARVLDVLPAGVRTVTCVTRWFPEEVAVGVSDLEIYDRLAARPDARLLLHPHLHAKFYRAGRRCLVGSANLTGRALGWSSPPNLELLVELDAELPGLAAFEANLLAFAVPADAALRDAIQAAAERLRRENRIPSFGAAEIDYVGAAVPRVWLPVCSTPDRLWNVYANYESWRLVASAAEAAKMDLLALGPPSGLPRAIFDRYIAAALKQMPLVTEIDQRAAVGITDNEAVAMIIETAGSDGLPYAPIDMWEVLKAWLGYFFPNSYHRTAQGEVLIRGRQITS